jgi:DNA ligase-1
MLAQSADAVEDAMASLGDAALEYKLDGARVQLHRSGDEVRVFTRSLKDVTGSVPELVEAARALPVREIVLDGEAIALRPDGSPLPFQDTMRRFGRKLDIAAMREQLPLAGLYFDCLYLDGESLIDEEGRTRFEALADVLPEGAVVPRIITSSPAEAAGFLHGARERGHEGIVAKALDAAYDAGRRGRSWIKVKPANTLDLVILAAEWGHGRRAGWLSNLHLGARDPDAGGFVMLGKTFKGLTDEMLVWQTEALQRIEIARDGHTVYVRPELVAEVAFNEIQASPRYPGGLALRFARIKSWRSDKRPGDADTIATVRDIFERQTGLPGGG